MRLAPIIYLLIIHIVVADLSTDVSAPQPHAVDDPLLSDLEQEPMLEPGFVTVDPNVSIREKHQVRTFNLLS